MKSYARQTIQIDETLYPILFNADVETLNNLYFTDKRIQRALDTPYVIRRIASQYGINGTISPINNFDEFIKIYRDENELLKFAVRNGDMKLAKSTMSDVDIFNPYDSVMITYGTTNDTNFNERNLMIKYVFDNSPKRFIYEMLDEQVKRLNKPLGIKKTYDFYNIMYLACEKNDIELIKKLYDKYDGVVTKYNDRDSLLYWIINMGIRFNNLDIIEFALLKGGNINYLLKSSAQKGNFELMKYAIENGATDIQDTLTYHNRLLDYNFNIGYSFYIIPNHNETIKYLQNLL